MLSEFSWLVQELTRVGLLNVPDWADAGKVYIESENAIPFSSLLMVQLFLFNFVGESLRHLASQLVIDGRLVSTGTHTTVCCCL